MLNAKKITIEEVRFLAVGGTYIEPSRQHTAKWLPYKSWVNLTEISDKLPRFKETDLEFTNMPAQCQHFYESQDPLSV